MEATALFPLPQRDPTSWHFDLALARDLAIMTLFWILVQVSVFLLPLRDSFGCHKSPALSVKDLPKDYVDTCNRIVSILHASFCIISTSYYFLIGYGNNIHIVCGQSTTDIEYFITIVSTGYFIYDLIGMLYLGILDSDGVFHHGAVIIITTMLIRHD